MSNLESQDEIAKCWVIIYVQEKISLMIKSL